MPPSRDIVVIGAGVIGCATAYELARRGVSVEIVDDRPAGMGATQASAGLLAPFVEADAESPLLGLAVRSLELYDDFIARIVAESGVAVPYRRTGTLNVATNEQSLQKLRKTADALSSRGVPADFVDGPGTRTQEPHLASDVVGGLLIPSHGFVAASELTRGLAAAARRHGAQLVEKSRVLRILRDGSDLVVETDRGHLTCDAVVLAAGSWSSAIDVDGVTTRVPVRPVRGQLLYLSWTGPSLRRATWSDRCYLVPWDDGTVLVGATVEEADFDERTTVAGVRDLLDAACEIVPHAWTVGFLGARVGLRPASPDELPVIGPSAILPNLMYATAHFRNGILLAPLTAALVADAMLDGRVDPMLAAVSPSRFGAL
jgi:glycine oxidase